MDTDPVEPAAEAKLSRIVLWSFVTLFAVAALVIILGLGFVSDLCLEDY
jgi:hypothetical protein